MTLEIILGELLAGFGTGFWLGIRQAEHDYRIESCSSKIENVFKNFPVDETEKKKELEMAKDADLIRYDLKKLFLALINFSGSAIINSATNADDTMAGVLGAGLFTLIGAEAGRAYSNLRRKKNRLTNEEKEKVDSIFEQMKQDLIEGKPIEIAAKTNSEYMDNLLRTKMNPEIDDYLNFTTGQIIKYCRQYNQVKEQIEPDDTKIATMLLNPAKDDKGIAIIIHDNELYSFELVFSSYKRLKDDKTKQITDAIFPSSFEPNKIEWDGTIEGILRVSDANKDRNVFLVSNSNAPLLLKMMSVYSAYADVYARKNFKDE